MRATLRSASLLLACAIALAGCTSDGNLGTLEPGQRPPAVRGEALWATPAAAHAADIRMGGHRLDLEGTLPPLELEELPLAGAAARDAFRTTPALRFALAGAVLEGERGWLVFDAASAPELEAVGGRIVVREHALRAEGPVLSARLSTSALTLMTPPPIACFKAFPTEGERAECEAHRARELPPEPEALANLTDARFAGVQLPREVVVRGFDLTFYANGTERQVGSGVTVQAAHATLVAFVDGVAPFAQVTLDVPVAPPSPLRWEGNLTVRASPPAGEILLGGEPRLLAPYNEATVKLREGSGALSRGEREWSFEAKGAHVVDVRTGPTPRLGATLRLAPDVVEAAGPAGNATRVKLILAETSGGADAHVRGYRADSGVQLRYVGAEPFSATRELLQLMNETGAHPITAPMLVGIGVALPFVAFFEGIAGFFQALFPPSLAGTMGAGEAQVLTFELLMPDEPRDVTLRVEAENAEAVTATLRLRPT